MKCLLDTCTFIWLVSAPGKLPRAVRAVLQTEKNSLFLSDVSILEISLKWNAGKLKLPDPPRKWCEEQCGIWNLEPLCLERSSMYRAAELPKIHSDPFDRLLVATAIEIDCTLVTPDPSVAEYPVSIYWA